MLEALEYTAIALAPLFGGAIAYLIIAMVIAYFVDSYKVFRKRS
jgi:hypothetical protein